VAERQGAYGVYKNKEEREGTTAGGGEPRRPVVPEEAGHLMGTKRQPGWRVGYWAG
jgi:hypothetical protein